VKTLAKLLYVEADEEITDLVDRLRDLSLEDEVTFVVPERARALQSPMNFRLLKRYADSYGKKVNLISADSRLQAMALEAGFTAYPSMGAYDLGTQVHQPSPVDGDGFGTGQPAESSAVSQPIGGSVATLERPRQAAVISAPAKKPAAPARALSAGPTLRQYRPYLIAAGVLVVLGLLAGLLYLPTATATLFVSGTSIKQDITLNGAPDAQSSGDVFPTQAVHASESQNLPGTATGQKQVPAQPSSGSVTFNYNCLLFCDNNAKSLPAGITVSTNDGKQYKTQKSVTLSSPHGSASVQVTAAQAGPNGNTDAHTITVINDSRYRDFNLSVDNPQATSGGADPRTATVIAQSDIDSIKDAYAKDAVPRIKDQLISKANSQKLVIVGGDPQITVKADHNVGDEVSGFGVTLTVKGDGVVFDEKAVKSLLKTALERKLPQGTQLTSNLNLTYEPINPTADGRIQLNGHAAGFYTPIFPVPEIKSNLKGKSIPSAREYFNRQWSAYVKEARITQAPFALPWLPLFSSRITVNVEEVTSPSST
jgi:hypothetical protein